jgi:hypothetical protein
MGLSHTYRVNNVLLAPEYYIRNTITLTHTHGTFILCFILAAMPSRLKKVQPTSTDAGSTGAITPSVPPSVEVGWTPQPTHNGCSRNYLCMPFYCE